MDSIKDLFMFFHDVVTISTDMIIQLCQKAFDERDPLSKTILTSIPISPNESYEILVRNPPGIINNYLELVHKSSWICLYHKINDHSLGIASKGL
jgi:hypothetical protein